MANQQNLLHIPQNTTIAVVKKRKIATMANFRPKNKIFNKNDFTMPTQIGRSRNVEVFISEGGKVNNTITFSLSWTLLAHAYTRHDIAALFVSAVGAYMPDLSQVMIECLNDRSIDVELVDTPSEASERGYDVERLEDRYSPEEVLLNLGISLLLIFKNIHEKNYDGFVNARKRALGGTLGLVGDELKKYKYPLSLQQAELLKSMFTGNIDVQRGILNWVMWASEGKGQMRKLADYMGSLLAWSEMSLLVFISNVFVHSGSPVLRQPLVQDELETYKKCMTHILRSPTPSYYRYFAPSDVVQMMKRQNFQLLGAVAQELIRRRSKNKSIDNFIGTAETGSTSVKLLADVHEEFCRSEMMGKNSRMDFFFGDYDYDEIVDADEAERGLV